jgi:hypothetical protein
MDQSLSGGSGKPLRMTLTLICSLRESSNMRENYSMRGSLGGGTDCVIARRRHSIQTSWADLHQQYVS